MPNQLETIRHSLSHILAEAVCELYPSVQLGIGPAIDNGFYYDFLFEKPIEEKELKEIQKKMIQLINQKREFVREEMSIADAKKKLKGQKFKLELLADLEKAGEQKVSFYTSGNFTDMCAGPHIESTAEIAQKSWKLDKTAGAYWRGSEKNQMLTRIYGLAFESAEALNTYEQNLIEAKKRDHRVLGASLDLYHIDDKVGLGLPLWHPTGAMLWRKIEDFWNQAHEKNGYDFVRSPHIGNRILWETSGHWGFYSESMYPPMEVGQTLAERQAGKTAEVSEEYLIKPMNCPFHVQIYANSPKSYRDFPMRWAECGTVYRFEKKGQLSGLTRVRGFTQDDAHIFCRADQVEDELKRVVDFILYIYESFGFPREKVKVYLSLRDPENKKKYAGNDAGWELTENILRKVANEKKLDVKEEKGEAAFYGPKLDFKIQDVLGREWQCSTLQFDFNLPERFDMTFTNSENKDERPYMLHRALFGSFERFIGLLIEHYAGEFPLWLAPTQVMIVPVSEKFNDYAEKVYQDLKNAGIRTKLDVANDSLGKKVRNAEMKKIPRILVVGEQEMNNKTVTVRVLHSKEQTTVSVQEFIAQVQKSVEDKK